MLKYLKSLRQLKAADPLVVAGNQAADMDSCCSAIVTAYLETERGMPAVALIDIPRQDLKLRKDVEYIFQNLDIDSSWLLFNDDITLNASTPLFLVDHNAPTTSGKVLGVIDHHELEGGDLSTADPNIIVKAGSCMSNIVNYYANFPYVTALFNSDPILAPLAMAPILLDTNNLTNKVEPVDIEAVKYLEQFSFQFSPALHFTDMKSAKKDISGLSAVELLRKDYKQWDRVGISSLSKLFNKLTRIELAKAMEAQQNNVDIFVTLASGTSKKVYVRKLAYFGPNFFDIARECPSLKLEYTGSEGKVKFYNQLNTEASRKQVAPILKAALAQANHVEL